MDPATALGLATNVAQLVDYSWRIVSTSREIYRYGALPEHRDIQTVTADLQKINDSLLGFLNSAEKAENLSEDEEALRHLCESSNRIATELVKRLSSVEPGHDHRSWKSIRQALKSVWIKGELDETATRLQMYRTQLNTRILVSLRDKIDSVERSGRNIASSISESRVVFNTNQEIQTDFLTRFSASQHEKTRELLSSLTVAGVALPAYPSSPGWTSPSPSRIDSKEEIFAAVKAGSIPKLRSILREDPSTIFAFSATGQTPLHVAAGRGDADMVNYLIRNGARINPDDDEGQLPLHNAVEVGSEPIVRALLARGADIHAKNMKGRAPRELCDPLSLISWIFTHGFHLEAKDDTGSTALWHFASRGDIDTVRILLDQGADTEAICWAQKTPLFPACDGGYVDIVELLLARGADVKQRDDRQSTPLVSTGCHGHTRIGELLLDYGADINAVNQHKFSALHECCDHGRVDMALMLLRRGSRFESLNDWGYAPIYQASMHGHVALVKEMLDRGVDVNLLNPRTHWTALAEACEHGHQPIVELLLSRGADTEQWTDRDRKVALIRAAEHGYTEIVKLMLDLGRANLDTADKNGKTALYWAVTGGHAETTQLLLSRSPYVDVRDPTKYTPLCRAAQASRLDLVRMLLESGANANAQQQQGWAPIHEASSRGDTEIIKLLLRYAADPDLLCERHRSPLSIAAEDSRVDAAKLLLETGRVNVNNENTDGWSALAEASMRGQIELTRALVKHGASANTRDNNKDTPLYQAAQRGHLGVAILLLDEGKADIDAQNRDGWTSLAEACWHDHPDVVKALLQRGAKTDILVDGGVTALYLAKVKPASQVVALLEEHAQGRDGWEVVRPP